MRRPVIIGITGGIGGGKSTFSNYLRECGGLVYDTDLEAKRLQNENEELKNKIILEFGSDIYNENGLNRPKLAYIVFSDPEKLKTLNQLVHPEVKKDFQQWVHLHSDKNFLFMECAILFEGGFDELVDKVILITAPEDVRIKRVMKRDNVAEEKVLARIRNQINEELKMENADWIFNTDNDELPPQRVCKFLKELENDGLCDI